MEFTLLLCDVLVNVCIVTMIICTIGFTVSLLMLLVLNIIGWFEE